MASADPPSSMRKNSPRLPIEIRRSFPLRPAPQSAALRCLALVHRCLPAPSLLTPPAIVGHTRRLHRPCMLSSTSDPDQTQSYLSARTRRVADLRISALAAPTAIPSHPLLIITLSRSSICMCCAPRGLSAMRRPCMFAFQPNFVAFHLSEPPRLAQLGHHPCIRPNLPVGAHRHITMPRGRDAAQKAECRTCENRQVTGR